MQLGQKSKLHPMLDHASRIRAQQQQAAEHAEMEELEARTAPLLWSVYFAAIAVTLGLAVDGWNNHAAHYLDMAAQSEAMVQCINGRSIGLDDAVLHCEVSQYKLVGGLKS